MLRSVRSFYLIAGILFIGMIGLLVPVRGGGALVSLPLTALFSNTDGSPCIRPCLLGIRPRQMTFRTAVTILQNHPLVASVDTVACGQTRGDCSFTLRYFNATGVLQAAEDANRDAQLVELVYLSFPLGATAAPSIGDFVALMGDDPKLIPHYDCCDADALQTYRTKLEQFAPTYGLTLFFSDYGAEVTDWARWRGDDYALQRRSQARSLLVQRERVTCKRYKRYWEAWPGFATLTQYARLPLIKCQ